MSRALDAAVARALGREVVERGGEYWYDGGVPHRVEPFSECGNAMLELDAEMRARGWSLEIDRSLSTIATYSKYKHYGGFTEAISVALDTPKAVALAAYHALTGKKWSE